MDDTEQLVTKAGGGDPDALDQLFAKHRERLLRMVRLRLDRRLHGRVDASDVIQDTHVEAVRRLEAYLADENRMPFFLWLRFLAGERVIMLHRHHLGAQRRDARLEVRLHGGPLPEATSAALAFRLIGRETAPSQAAVRAERRIKLQDALNTMDTLDREVLALRHFEHLNNVEAARELGLQESAASKRYIRALKKLKEILARMPGGERPY